jgi:glycosyltransferase 2 family protein
MKKIFLFLLSLTIGIVVFGVVTSKVGLNDIAQAFTLFSIRGLVVILFLTLIIALTDVWKLKFILKSQGQNVSYSGVLEVWLTGFAISYLTPIAIWGGELFMIYTLKNKYKISWEESGAAVFIFRVIDATIFFPFLILGVILFPFLTNTFPVFGILISGAIVTGIFIVLLVNFYFKSFKNKSVLEGILKFFGKDKKKFEEGKGGKLMFGAEKEVIRFFGTRKKAMWMAIGNSLLKYTLIVIRAWLLLFFFKGGLNILKALSIYGFFNLSCLVPLPAQLGSLETAEAIVFNAFGLGANVGVAFSLVLRAMDSLVCLIGLLLILKVGIELIKKRIMVIIDKIFSREPEE